MVVDSDLEFVVVATAKMIMTARQQHGKRKSGGSVRRVSGGGSVMRESGSSGIRSESGGNSDSGRVTRVATAP